MNDEFLRSVRQHSKAEKQKEEQSEEAIGARLKWWTQQVEELFASVRAWLKPLIDDQTIEFEISDLTIHEEWLGQYASKWVAIRLGRAELKMEPIGTVILGSFGRVDLSGPRGRLMLILEAERGTKETGFVLTGGRWFIVTKEQGRRRGTPLTEETFGEAFKHLFGIVE